MSFVARSSDKSKSCLRDDTGINDDGGSLLEDKLDDVDGVVRKFHGAAQVDPANNHEAAAHP